MLADADVGRCGEVDSTKSETATADARGGPHNDDQSQTAPTAAVISNATPVTPEPSSFALEKIWKEHAQGFVPAFTVEERAQLNHIAKFDGTT